MHTYRPDIDGLRALAVLLVVLCHAGMPFAAGGYVGVDVFFVISGFLITFIIVREIEEERFSLIGFYERRARRLFPALFAMLAFTLIASALLLFPAEFERVGESTLAAALFGSNFYFWQTLNYFAPTMEFEPLLHTWSLGVEEQFYLLFPVLLLGLTSTAFKARLPKVLITLTLASLVLCVIVMAWRPTAAFYLLPFRAWELGVGCLLAVIPLPTMRSDRWREGLAVAALLAIAVPALVYSHQTSFPGLAAIPPVLGAGALIYLGSQPNRVSRALSSAPLVTIGLISYSLYLWHWPIFALMRATSQSVTLSWFQTLLALGLSFALAWASYRFIERPFRSGDWLLPPRKVLPASLIAIIVFSLAGLIVAGRDGFQERLPREALAALKASDDRHSSWTECMMASPEAPRCVVGEGIDGHRAKFGPTSILLWGDSHAAALVPALEQAGKIAGKRATLAIRAGCPPVARLGRNHETSEQCIAYNDAVLKELIEGDDYDVVVLAARWPFYVEGQSVGNENKVRVALRHDDPLTPLTKAPLEDRADDNVKLLTNALEQTVQAIEATGRRVVLLGPTPEIGWHVPNGVARALWSGTAPPAGPSREVVEKRAGQSISLLRSIEARSSAQFIDLVSPMCKQTCAVSHNGQPAYFDDDHLSANTGRAIIAPVLVEALNLNRTQVPIDALDESPEG